MKILDIRKSDDHISIKFKIVEELKDGYIVNLYKEYKDDNNNNICNISVLMRLSVDELYYLQNPSEENINKFNDRFEQVLSLYIRRNTT